MAAGGRTASLDAQATAAGRGGRAGVADVARTARHRRGAGRQAAARVERDEERPVEGARCPGAGKSSPIVWRDTVYVTTAVPGEGGALQFTLVAINRADGKEKWSRRAARGEAARGPPPGGTYAGGSALTDGQRLYAWFGSRGLYAVDFTGKVLWEKSLGQMQTRNGFGEGSSVAIHDGTLVVPWDHEGADFVIALDAATGKEKWRTPREEPTTWATPLIVAAGGAPQVVLSGTNRVVGYDLATGKQLWQAGGTTMNAIPSPVFADGLVIAMGGFRGSMARAIRIADAKGDVTGTPAQAWTYEKDTPYVPSPLLYRGAVYFLKVNSGILTSLDAKTGAVRFTERLAAVPNVYASPVGRRRPHLRRRPRGHDGRPRRRAGRRRCWRPTSSTTPPTRRRRWSTASSTCAAPRACTASPRTDLVRVAIFASCSEHTPSTLQDLQSCRPR